MKATPAQHAMWLNERLGIAGAAYHMPLPVTLTGPLDTERLTAACAAVVQRHPGLGGAFAEIDGELHVVPAERPPHVTFEPSDDVTRPFDLARGPLIRFRLTQTGPSRHELLIVAHHLVFDGQSKDVLLRDLAAAYNGARLDPLGPPEPVEFAPVPAPPAGEVLLPGLGAVAQKAQPGECLDFEVGDVRVAGLTRFELLLSVLCGLLTRYGNADPVVAIDLGTRTADTDCHVGLFVNERTFAPPVHDGQSAEAFAHTVKAALRDLYPLRRNPVRSEPKLALAPVSLSYRKRAPQPRFEGLTADVEWMAFHHAARNALHVQMVDDGQTVRVRFQYAPAQLSRADAERLATHFQRLLDAFLSAPGTAVADLPMLADGELSELAGPTLTVPSGRMDQLIRGDGTAVTGAGLELSYAELDAAAEAVAVALRDSGVRPGDRVAVRMRRTPQLIAALLGVWKAGAAYVPLDPGYPAARQSLLLSDAAPKAVLSEDGVTALDGGSPSTSDLAYVIYTSGSTGRPKGVRVRHDAVANLMHAMRHALDLPERPVWLAVASFAFDMSVPELWLPLTLGGTVVLATEDETRDAERLLKLIRGHGVTHVHVTPSTWQRLLDAGFDEPAVVAVSGAEALPDPLAQRIRQRSAALWNLYGPTETTVWATCARVGDGPVTLGTPLANTTVSVVDPHSRPVPRGIPGELRIGGAGVAAGYHDRPELTAERFTGGGYRTGDRVRMRLDGELEWIGRTDDQIKLRGYRIELGEVEARLLEHPHVRAAAAAVRDDTLIAYVVGDFPGDAADLTAHMAETLPPYMVPARYVTLPELPRNAHGKLDRALLPEPAAEPTLDLHEGFARQVYDIWCEVLGRTDIGPDDDLFDLGGHSLTVTKIAARMRRHLGVDIPLHVFFDTPTIAGLVAHAKP